ncbi:MAG: Cu(I)-responsive transcriptional regulator [Sulfuricaulis sp.]
MELQSLNIGEAADASGVSAKMIRHYEEIGLIPKVKRTEAGYRLYSGHEIHELRFIRQARNLGFSTQQIAELLKLWRDHRRPSARVKQLALEHVRELDEKIEEMRAMKTTLEHLARNCHGDDRPDCPILDGLASPKLGRYSRLYHDGIVKAPRRALVGHQPRRVSGLRPRTAGAQRRASER